MIYGIDSVLGGQDFYDENGYVGHSVESITGNGQDFYDKNGNFVGYTVDSLVGNGQNFYGADGSRSFSVDSVLGSGQDIFGDRQGFTVDSPFGGTDVFVNDD